MTTSEQSLAAVLDETIVALSKLDAEQLVSLEETMLLLANSCAPNASSALLLERQQVLGRVLAATQSNLTSLTCLHQRNGMDQWVR